MIQKTQIPGKWAVKITAENVEQISNYVLLCSESYHKFYVDEIKDSPLYLKNSIGDYFCSTDIQGYLTTNDPDISGHFTKISQTEFDQIFNSVSVTKEGIPVLLAETDNVNHPSHYTQHKFECIDVIEEVTKDLHGIEAHCIGNIFKYLWRFKKKNGVEDCEKAAWYLSKLIKTLKQND